MMDKELRCVLLSLLEGAVLEHPVSEIVLSEAEWMWIYSESCRQGVCGEVLVSVTGLSRSCGISPSIYGRWLLDAANIRNRTEHMCKLAGKMEREWKKKGIRAVLMKGPFVAELYPDPSLRLSGDLDWWFPEKKAYKAAIADLDARNVTLKYDSDGAARYVRDGVTIELHREGYDCRRPEATLLMLMDHLFHHVSTSGAGLRQLCDLAAAYQCYYGSYDRESYISELNKRHLGHWCRLVESVLAFTFGPDGLEEDFELRADTDALMGLIWTDGAFGRGKKKRFSFFFRRAALCGRYAPVAFVKRWAGLAVGRIKTITGVK